MTKNEAEYCKECKNCKQITCINNDCMVICNEKMGNRGVHSKAVIYCKYKKIKKRK